MSLIFLTYFVVQGAHIQQQQQYSNNLWKMKRKHCVTIIVMAAPETYTHTTMKDTLTQNNNNNSYNYE